MSPRRGRPRTQAYGVMCRSYGHVWMPRTVTFHKVERIYHVTLICDRCATLRSQWMTQHGHVTSNSYRYVEGYLSKAPREERPSKDDYRLMNVLGMEVHQVEAEVEVEKTA